MLQLIGDLAWPWGWIGDVVGAAAVIDRLVRRAELVSVKGDRIRRIDRDPGRWPGGW